MTTKNVEPKYKKIINVSTGEETLEEFSDDEYQVYLESIKDVQDHDKRVQKETKKKERNERILERLNKIFDDEEEDSFTLENLITILQKEKSSGQ